MKRSHDTKYISSRLADRLRKLHKLNDDWAYAAVIDAIDMALSDAPVLASARQKWCSPRTSAGNGRPDPATLARDTQLAPPGVYYPLTAEDLEATAELIYARPVRPQDIEP
ncbi:MAG TPA: hypothetical protein VJY33_22200 [Isosphaeraceae bacterium]|nr:hypothetical protein [Isosphaeraceae bacterium]